MTVSPLVGMRIWVAFLTFINFSVVISLYSYSAHLASVLRKEGFFDESYSRPHWRDWVSIITAVIVFAIYAYSVWTRNKTTSLIQNRFLRAVLILIPTCLLLYVECSYLNDIIESYNSLDQRLKENFNDPEDYEFFRTNVFECPKEVPFCFLSLSSVFLGVITGSFILIEVIMSLFMRRAQPTNYGHGVSKDYVEAMTWCRKAAEQGHADGQFCIGQMFENGLGMTKDMAKALKWYKKAAKQEDHICIMFI
ncbi:hypothetical protein EC991_007349 [Linnemannia zychae]|nr:hypothetical protein EC991_007349 [Linnemannia zychae]